MLARAKFVVGLFFAVSVVVVADDQQLRNALDQLSVSYADAQLKIRDRDAAVKTLTESLTIARTESEMFQKLWTEAAVRLQTLGANLTETDATSMQRQFVGTLRALYVADAERERLIEQMQRLLVAVESNREVAGEIEATKRLLASNRPVALAVTTAGQGSAESARVMEVNAKLQLVVLDVGTEQGARVGMPMVIEHGDQVVAEVRIVEVRQKICGALIEKVENKVMPAMGDVARAVRN